MLLLSHYYLKSLAKKKASPRLTALAERKANLFLLEC